MGKDITISDEVYRKLKREKGDQSFNEVIEEHLAATGRLADVTEQRVIDEDAFESVKRDVEQLSEGSLDRTEDEAR